MTPVEAAEREAVRLRQGDERKVLFWLWPPYGPPEASPITIESVSDMDSTEEILERLDQFGDVTLYRASRGLNKSRRVWCAYIEMKIAGAATTVRADDIHHTSRSALSALESKLAEFRQQGGNVADWRAA